MKFYEHRYTSGHRTGQMWLYLVIADGYSALVANNTLEAIHNEAIVELHGFKRVDLMRRVEEHFQANLDNA